MFSFARLHPVSSYDSGIREDNVVVGLWTDRDQSGCVQVFNGLIEISQHILFALPFGMDGVEQTTQTDARLITTHVLRRGAALLI
jgi:hypothetical protein